MSQGKAIPQLATEIRTLLARLRWRIRAYIWIEGILLATIWLAATFWAGLAIDYLPVVLGASEMPRGARAGLLILIAGVLAYILYRWVFRRTFARLSDRSMAVLIERRYGDFSDSLVTSVEMSDGAPGEQFNPEMLERTFDEARERVKQVRLAPLFNLRPLIRYSLVAALLVVPAILFYATNASAWELLVNRLYLLRNDPWPRSARIEVVGLEPQTDVVREDENVSAIRPFRNRLLKAARGSSMKLIVRADSRAKVVPEICTIYYRTADGNRGWINMNRIGRPRDGYQAYEYAGAPFSGMISDVEFDVLGYDHRLYDYRVSTVDSPAIVGAELDCHFPDYMTNEKLDLWLPRTIDITPGLELPRGTTAVLRGRANKDLQRVLVHFPKRGETKVIDLAQNDSDRRSFEFPLGSLSEALQLELTLHDTDDVIAERPHRLYFPATNENRSPKVPSPRP